MIGRVKTPETPLASPLWPDNLRALSSVRPGWRPRDGRVFRHTEYGDNYGTGQRHNPTSNPHNTTANAELLALMDKSIKELREHSIVRGTVIDIKPQVILVDSGYKSEGAIPI